MDHTKMADKFEQCADILETDGWVRGHILVSDDHPRLERPKYQTPGENEDEYGRCAVGVMCHVSENFRDTEWISYADLQIALSNHLRTTGKMRFGGVVDWNNEVASGKYEVIDTFREVAKSYRNAVSLDQ